MIAQIGWMVKPLALGAVAALVHMIETTATQKITPYQWRAFG